MAKHKARVDLSKYFHNFYKTDYGPHYNISYHNISNDGNVIGCQIIIVDDTKSYASYRKAFKI